MSQPKTFNYDAFIYELAELLARAEKFTQQDRNHSSENFRKWQHEIIDLIHRIEKQKHSINCNIRNRTFIIYGYGSYSKFDQQKKFDRDLQDTINELSLVIENYRKYGDPIPERLAQPTTSNQSASSDKLSWPEKEKLTLKWLVDHMPAAIWLSLLAAFVTVAGFAYAISYWACTHQVITPEMTEVKPAPLPTTDTKKAVNPVKSKNPHG